MECLQEWPEPVVSVKYLAESGLSSIPDRYIKPPSQRPRSAGIDLRTNHSQHANSRSCYANKDTVVHEAITATSTNIPAVDLKHICGENQSLREETLRQVSEACREWGFFQILNHGVSHELMKVARETWREFFNLPLEVKKEYANSPLTYEGFGSRLGVQKGALLDWSDYYFLHYMPASLRNQAKWPALPTSCRKVIAEYAEEVMNLGGRLLKLMSINLGLQEDFLENAFGGEENMGGCLRVNFYPKCPQPDLTLGLSPHSDPGGMTILLPDDNVSGLQVRRGDEWVTVKPLPNAFIVNIGDQIQVMTNAIYKSVEHRVIVNSLNDRVSLAFFYNPKSDLLIQPAEELLTEDRPALYSPMTFDEYRLYIRTKGPCGKAQVESMTPR